MATYLDIALANEQIKTVDIKGKEYSEVNQRIKAFRINHPNGSIATHIESLEDGVVVMSCEVRDENGNLLGKAHAYEREDSSFINKTSYIENCCTSATGRALGYAGYGIDTSVASYEEVANAIENQQITEEDALKYTLKFGKYKDRTIKEVYKDDPKYIDWIVNNTQDENLLKIIELTTGIVLPDKAEQEERLSLIMKIQKLVDDGDIDLDEVKEHYIVKALSDMTTEELWEVVDGNR